MNNPSYLLVGLVVLSAIVSFVVARPAGNVQSFFTGLNRDGRAPTLWILTFSQVTTWIFARSLLTAAILGYYYGVVGGLAYTAYYLSFFTGGAIVHSLRFRHGYSSVQSFLSDRFGAAGVTCYNIVISIRLMSEVFANLLVVGIIFGKAGSDAYILSIVLISGVTLAYSMLGGLNTSLRTDFFQMSMFLVAFSIIFAYLLSLSSWSGAAVFATRTPLLENGGNLLLVALLQVWSYPLHDPVMMDRGFIADKKTTRSSFIHAGWISMACIFLFSLFGVYAGLVKQDGQEMTEVLAGMLGAPMMALFNFVLILSAISTLDSTFSSAAKLTAYDMKWVKPTVFNGRVAMALFLLGGLLFLYLDSKDLFTAVAVSGTAAMYLTPVVFFSLWGNWRVPLWPYIVSFVVAVGGAVWYYLEAGGKVEWFAEWFGISIKYNKLLVIAVTVAVVGCAAFLLGMAQCRFRKNS